jgi:D-alanyl-D-alanine dipeptidase
LRGAAERTGRAGIDGLIVTPSADLLYLIGYDPPPYERLTALIVRPGLDPVLVAPELEQPRAAESPAGALMEIRKWTDGEDPYGTLRSVLADSGLFAVSDRMLAVHLLGLQRSMVDAKFISASSVLAPLRARKEEGEIQLLGQAARSADEAFRRISAEILEGRREEEVAASLTTHLVDAGHDSAAFTIVASGPNAASPHHLPGGRAVQMGDAVVLDIGGRIDGYCSDLTRTLSVGEPSRELAEVHEIVREAQETAFQTVAPGVPAQDIDRAARKVIADSGYEGAFIHRTGHGIGLEEHEPPYLVEGNEDPLQPGMCFSIEPGIYVEGRFGVRIEDIVTLADEGPLRLNHAPHELSVVT